MEISAHLRDRAGQHDVRVSTAGNERPLVVAAKANGRGGAVNGGELLMAALATCYCNDLYREAARLGIGIDGCEVIASAVFDGIGQPARSITYAATVESSAAPAEVEHLLAETDRRAEVHNTIRAGIAVGRVAWNGRPA
ncbi:MAG: OsmC family protein [Dokdonella sp.]|uniref:OsmC family protein n=1 Tax=Dokdonella sp. TaxID=2291710 RepID=UPI003F7F8859